MVFHRSHESLWGGVSLKGLNIDVKPACEDAFPGSISDIPPHFWGRGFRNGVRRLLGMKSRKTRFPVHPEYRAARELIGDGTVVDLEALCSQAETIVGRIFDHVQELASASSSDQDQDKPCPSLESGPRLVQLRLSPELERWKHEQHAAGNVLPPKGFGLTQASNTCIEALGAETWHQALTTNNTMFGCGIVGFFMGGADAQTVFSNYVNDMAFYYEHGFNEIFPTLEPLVEKGMADRRARQTRGGAERREAVRIGKRYIQGKIELEKKHKGSLSTLSARLSLRDAMIVSLSESSLMGMVGELIARGFNPAAVMSDMIFSSPGTDVVDVGCDLVNCEVLNSFLNVSDITDTGVVGEDVLRRIYDAYAATGARMLTVRWHEPAARMCSALYTWHIMNDRHMFFRRAMLGWPKARKTPARPQREADFDEVFDADHRLTGFSRPIDPEYECNGEETCDHVKRLLHFNKSEPLLGEFWEFLVTAPLEYVRGGRVSGEREYELVEGSRIRMAKLYSRGVILETLWLMAHADHHAWQVNYLFEAAMFGSILDSGKLAGKLDRHDA